MGCWDIYCFLCGNTCHGPLGNLKEIFFDNIKYYQSITDQKKKKLYLNNYLNQSYIKYNLDPKKFLSTLNNVNKTTKWLDKCTFLSANNKVVHGCKEISCNISFRDKKSNHYIQQPYFESAETMYGVFIHTDCWKFILNEYGITLTYSHLPITNFDREDNKIFNFVNYDKIEKYWEQYFNFIKMVGDSNEELCSSPLKSNLVAKNIKKVFIQLKIKTDDKRISPWTSATFYSTNTYKVGSNGNIWFIKLNKWIQIKDTIQYKFTLKNKNIIKKLVYLGSANNEPMFIYSIEKDHLICLTTKEYLEKKYKIKL